MARFYYAPIARNELGYFQSEILPPDEIELFSKDNFEKMIRNYFEESEDIVQLKSGKFHTKIYRSVQGGHELLFCLVDEYNYPAEYQALDFDKNLLAALRENLSLKLHYSEGIVIDQKISILNNYVLPSLRFGGREENVYYNRSYFGADHIIFGPPGSGKTTLLRRLALDILESDFASEDSGPKKLPVYIQLRDFNRYDLDFDTFIDFSIKNSFAGIDHVLPSKIGGWGNLYLLLDGADEIDFEKFQSFSETISAYKDKHPFIYFIISSRPDKSFDGLMSFTKCYIEPFTKAQIKELTYRKLGRSNQWKDFISILNIVPEIYDVLKNPLLLTLSHYLFSHKSILPTNTAQLLKEIVATLVSNWDAQRDIERKYHQRVVSPIEITHTLGLMALYLSEKGKYQISCRELYSRFGTADAFAEFEEYLQFIKFSTGLIEERQGNKWTFIDKSIQDFFCSAILTESVSALREQVLVEKNWESILKMISGLSSDPGYIISNVLKQTERSAEEKIKTTLSFYTESMLLTKSDLLTSFKFLEEYFLTFESDNEISEQNIRLSSDEIIFMLQRSKDPEAFLSVVKTVFNARFSKYEYDFSGYLASSKSKILKTFYNFSSKKGNMFVSYADNLVRVTYQEESPEIQE